MKIGKSSIGLNSTKKSNPKLKLFRKQLPLFIMALPAVIWYVCFCYAPLYGIQVGFRDYDITKGITNSKWVGLKYFKELFFNTPDFLILIKNTLIISGLGIITGTVCPVIFALLMNEIRNQKFKKTVQTITYLPYFVAWVTCAGIWYQMLSPQGGVVNTILVALHITNDPIFFMGRSELFVPILIFTSQWKNMGYSSIIYLAAIAGVDQEQYEAAYVDGAGRLKQTWHITLPAIKGTIILMLIFSISGLMSAGIDQILTMENIAVRSASKVIDTTIFNMVLNGGMSEMSLGSALSLFQSVIGLVLFLFANSIAKLLKQETVF